MALLVRLSVLAACAAVLHGSSVVITAPSTITDNTGGLETREQGPTAWICSALAVGEPWNAYANIRGYLEGGNAEGKDYSNLVLYPVMELFHASESRLCVYLPSEDHCYPPPPSNNRVKAVKQLTKRNYYAIRFWGQASDARVEYYKGKLTAALTTHNKAANFDIFFVSYFSNHVREVRYDPTDPNSRAGAPEPPLQIVPLSCPAWSDGSFSNMIVRNSNQQYTGLSVASSRLLLVDVETIPSNSTSLSACSSLASADAFNAFSFVNNTCKVYNFRKTFCPCARGDLDIYVNRRLLGEDRDFDEMRPEHNKKKVVIYQEIPFERLQKSQILSNSGFPIENSVCKYANPTYGMTGGSVDVNNKCYASIRIDFDNCNQVCKGDAANATVPDNVSARLNIRHFLSMCGQTIVAQPLTDNVLYVSHPGYGCYYYPEANTTEEEDCIVTFTRNPDYKKTFLYVEFIDLDRTESNSCQDELRLYEGNSTVSAINKCQAYDLDMLTTDSITVNFHRDRNFNRGSKNVGFAMIVESLPPAG